MEDGRFYSLLDREQPRLFAPSFKEAVRGEEDVMILDQAVEQLDLSSFEAHYTKVGHPAYPPKAMVKILIYGYALGMRSSRQLDRACRMDRAFEFLAHGLKPDFRTICRFRRKHAEALKELFLQTVRLCQEAGLVELGHVAIDGTKVRANRSPRTLCAKEALLKALEEAEEADEDILEEDEGEARFMKTSEGIKPAYNAQLAVDRANQVIVAQEVTRDPQDQGHLRVMVKEVRENLKGPPKAVSADGGYCSKACVEELEGQGIQTYVPLPKRVGKEFEWVEEEKAYRCPEGRLLHAYKEREGRKVYRTRQCGRCRQKEICGVKGQAKEIHVLKRESAFGRLAYRMGSLEGHRMYGERKKIVEPVLGRIKHNLGFRRFLLRGVRGARAEWTLMCLLHNLLKWAHGSLSLAGQRIEQSQAGLLGYLHQGFLEVLFFVRSFGLRQVKAQFPA